MAWRAVVALALVGDRRRAAPQARQPAASARRRRRLPRRDRRRASTRCGVPPPTRRGRLWQAQVEMPAPAPTPGDKGRMRRRPDRHRRVRRLRPSTLSAPWAGRRCRVTGGSGHTFATASVSRIDPVLGCALLAAVAAPLDRQLLAVAEDLRVVAREREDAVDRDGAGDREADETQASGAVAASCSTMRPMRTATIGSMTVSPAITRSGGPTEYAVCTKYAPTATAAEEGDQAQQGQPLEVAGLDALDDDLRERRHESVDDARRDDVEERLRALAQPDPQAAEHDDHDAAAARGS